ncbi:2OG-Fe dioxygenase family protein [Streptomyces syringium]|uniref:2OG-Fe dioxygenase family protein n=1 Tax=Streptomyces syringium TaxID=76729 RepID=UPI003AAAFE20
MANGMGSTGMVSTAQSVETTASQPSYSDGVEEICESVSSKSYFYLAGESVGELLRRRDANALQDWDSFQSSWNNMPLDGYMADGGRYRRRRHATLSAPRADNRFQVEPHQPHYQTVDYNTLNGGIARHYEPFEDASLHGPTMSSLLTLGCDLFGRLAPYSAWHIEAHQFRIEVTGGEAGREIAKPTPEGIHRDGVTFVMMLMAKRSNTVNGESTIYDLEKNPLEKFTLTDPLDLAIVNDERVFHGVSPIEQLDSGQPAVRDVLVITYRHKP